MPRSSQTLVDTIPRRDMSSLKEVRRDRDCSIFGRFRGNERPRPLFLDDNAIFGERLNGLAHGDTRQFGDGCDLAFGRQRVACFEKTLIDTVAQPLAQLDISRPSIWSQPVPWLKEFHDIHSALLSS